MDTTETISAGPEYWHAPVAAADAPREDFGMPQPHPDTADEHRSYEAHDFGGDG